jgi:tetratricopeptide (TPR) repeat protein
LTLLKAVPDIARAVAIVATGGNPLAGAVAANALQAILEDQDNQLNELERIKADTQSLVRGPYNTGMSWLDEAAQDSASARDRQEFLEKARDKFMEAQGQEHDLLYRALTEYQLGNCWALLGKTERARIWYQRAYASAYASDVLDSGLGEVIRLAVAREYSTWPFSWPHSNRMSKQWAKVSFAASGLMKSLERLRAEAPALAIELERDE